MKLPNPPPGSIQVWFVHSASPYWAKRTEFFVTRSRDAAERWKNEHKPKGTHISSGYIIYLRGRWYKILLNPVTSDLPVSWCPSKEALAQTLGLNVKSPDLVTNVVPFLQRLKILFTGRL